MNFQSVHVVANYDVILYNKDIQDILPETSSLDQNVG